MAMWHRHQAVDRGIGVASQLWSHGVGRGVGVHLSCQVLACSKMLEAEEAVPMACPTTAWVVVYYLLCIMQIVGFVKCAKIAMLHILMALLLDSICTTPYFLLKSNRVNKMFNMTVWWHLQRSVIIILWSIKLKRVDAFFWIASCYCSS